MKLFGILNAQWLWRICSQVLHWSQGLLYFALKFTPSTEIFKNSFLIGAKQVEIDGVWLGHFTCSSPTSMYLCDATLVMAMMTTHPPKGLNHTQLRKCLLGKWLPNVGGFDELRCFHYILDVGELAKLLKTTFAWGLRRICKAWVSNRYSSSTPGREKKRNGARVRKGIRKEEEMQEWKARQWQGATRGSWKPAGASATD